MQNTNTSATGSAGTAPAVGIDFGTTNSSIALADADGSVRFARFSAPQGTTASSRSLLYLQRQSTAPRKPVQVWSGPEAIAQYLAHDPFDDDVQGRLIQSLKSYLAARSFNGTEIFGRHYRVEDLVAKMLTDLRRRASEAFGFEVTRAVAGRPVWFVNADTEADNTFAEDRLRTAFLQAGWTDVQFALEPVAAAYSLPTNAEAMEQAPAKTAPGRRPTDTAATSQSSAAAAPGELILVGDFGGGTTDFSLLRAGSPGELPTVLGSTGVGLAGDAFDARIVRYAVSPAFGFGTVQRTDGNGPAKLIPALPASIYTALERWHTLSFLQTRQTMELLRTAELRAEEPRKIAALRTLVQSDLGYRLHQSVQRAKVSLSSQAETELQFDEEGLHIRVPITRTGFETWIAPELERVQASLDTLLADTATSAEAITHVFLTGGTSLVPAVQRVFAERFPAARLQHGDAFTSVAHGLARMAAHI